MFYFLDNLSSDQLFTVKEACEHYLQLNSSVSCEETVQYNKYTNIVFDSFSEVLNCVTSLVDDYGTTSDKSEEDKNEKINYFLHKIQINLEFIEFSYRVQEGKKRFESFIENKNTFYYYPLFEVDLNSMKYKKDITVLKIISDEKALSSNVMELLDLVDHTTLIVKEILSSYKIIRSLSLKSVFQLKICDISFNERKASKNFANWYGLLALEECEVSNISRINETVINLLNEDFNIGKGNFALIDSSFSFSLSTKCVVFLIEKEELSTSSASCETSDRGFTSEFLMMSETEDKDNISSSSEDKDNIFDARLTVSQEYTSDNTLLSATQEKYMEQRRDSYIAVDQNIIDQVNNVFNTTDNATIVSESARNIVMKVEKFRCLKPNLWLNDEVLNFYMDLLQERDNKICIECDKKTSYYFSSFFMVKLFDEAKKYNFEGVKKWSKRFKVFEQDKIFIPINYGNNHWFLIVVYIQQKKIIFYDSIAEDNRAKMYLFLTARWLQDEAKFKNQNIDINDWKLINAGRNIPQQTNSFDCGVYVILNADYIADDLPLSYGEEEVAASRNKIAYYIIKNNIPY